MRLIKAEALMFIGELKQYYLNYIFFNLGLITMFIGLFYTFNQNAAKQEAAILLIGLIIWQLCTSAFTYFIGVIEDEALMGTLEQILMTRTSILRVLFTKAFVTSIFNVLKSVVIFVICLLFFRCSDVFIHLGIKNLIIISITIFTLASFYFLGLFAAGLALFYKRVRAVAQIVNYILLFFSNITIAIELLPIAFQPIGYIVPISWAMRIIRELVFNDGITIIGQNILGLILSTALRGIIGLFGFNLSMDRAKKSGKLGHY